MTTTLFNIVRSELIKKGLNEFIDSEGNLVIFDQDHQFMTKIFNYDQDVSDIINYLFHGNGLDDQVHDDHFKKTFLYRFINRRMNRQTVESFKLELLSTFLTNQDYINRIYHDLDHYILQKDLIDDHNKQTNTGSNTQTNTQTSKQQNTQNQSGNHTTDTREAFEKTPQTQVNIDVDNTVMAFASDNTINRSKQVNTENMASEVDNELASETVNANENESITDHTNEKISYRLDELIKSSGLMESVFRQFDAKCFLQVW